MPYPNEHAFRLRDPGEFEPDSFRRENDKFGAGIHAIFGKLKGQDTMTLQAIRFDKDKWSFADAKKWIEDHNYKLIESEPASGKDMNAPLVKLIDSFGNLSRFDDASMIEEHIISTNHPDHIGDIMDFEGMELPPSGKAVVLLNHNPDYTSGLPVGKALGYAIKEANGFKQLWQTTQYNPSLPNEIGVHTYNARKNGYFRDSSIQFMATKYDSIQGGGTHYKEWRLLEAGPVLMGMNWNTGDMKALMKSFGFKQCSGCGNCGEPSLRIIDEPRLVIVTGEPVIYLKP
jgi:hypothetical protein